MCSSSLVSGYFARELLKLGYGDCDADWRLGYCQGDGMAFYGHPDLEMLANRLMSGHQRAAVKRVFNDKDGSIEIYDCNHHYHHWNSMSLSEEAGLYVELTPFEEESWCDFVEAIQDDVKEISQKLESDGYALLEAGYFEDHVDREFHTARYVVRFIRQPEDEYDISDMEDEDQDDIYQDIIDGKIRYFNLKIEVESNGLKLGSSHLGFMTESSERPDPTYSGYRKQKLEEAIAEARFTLKSICLKAAA